MDVAATMIPSGRYQKIIVIGTDQQSSVDDYKARRPCAIFGYGAAAVVQEGRT